MQFIVYGLVAKQIADGEVFVAKQLSVEGRKVIEFQRA